MRENKTLENFNKACYALLRIDGEQFFGELCELGFKVACNLMGCGGFSYRYGFF
jgi:hypothetical protein